MRDLDETDLDILRLLLEDARRPYSEIADRVGVSPPTVSDRVDRLQKLGVIRQFTLDVDRSTLHEGVPVLIEVELRPGADEPATDRLAAAGQVERVYETADRRLLAEATVAEDEAGAVLREALDMDDVADYRVDLLSEAVWEPQMVSPEIRLDVDADSDLTRTVDHN
ncbi:ArsR family transcriptional regulator [Halobacteriales archaeon QS_8_69_26]|nr:MAG: ArsR family transcriptional regulator [Halobacteriales archaeon QS_8_69_26]